MLKYNNFKNNKKKFKLKNNNNDCNNKKIKYNVILNKE